MIRSRKSRFYTLFFVVLLATEFYYIEVFGGTLRVYHFFAPLVIFILHPYIPRLPITRTFWALLGFLIVNAMAAAFADVPLDAFKSFGSLVANMTIPFAVALILVSERLSVEQVYRIVLGVSFAGVVLGVVQIAAYKLGGLNLGLSESQQWQIFGGFSSGFRTEANSFAKYLNVVFLLAFPTLLTSRKVRLSFLAGAILVLGMLTSFTRSALYGLIVSLFIYYLWFQIARRRKLLSKRFVLILLMVGICLFVFVSSAGQFNEYATYKISTFFDSNELLHGDSSGFRLMSQGLLWDAFLDNFKSFIIGNGWGQIRFSAYNREWQAGGAESILVLAWGGILGGIFYFLYNLTSINAVWRAVRTDRTSRNSKYLEGLLLALVGVLVTGQLNGSLLAPEYWMLFGLAMACEYNYKCNNAYLG